MSQISFRLGYGRHGIINYGENSFVTGNKAVGTTSVQLSTDSVPAYQGVLIKAKVGNSGIVYVDSANPALSTTGFELSAGESIMIPVDDANKVFLLGSANTQNVSFLVI